MKFFHENIAEFTQSNDNYRTILFTTKHSQLVLMSLPQGEQIPQEVHAVDQSLIIVSGKGEAIINGTTVPLSENSLLIIPAGTPHVIKNTGDVPLKLFEFYTPPQHAPGTVHKTQDDEKPTGQ